MINLLGTDQKEFFEGPFPRAGDIVELVCVKAESGFIGLKFRVKFSEGTAEGQLKRTEEHSVESA